MVNERQTKVLTDLYVAGCKVLDGLNARIQAASESGAPIPVFGGIAELHDALNRAEKTSDA